MNYCQLFASIMPWFEEQLASAAGITQCFVGGWWGEGREGAESVMLSCVLKQLGCQREKTSNSKNTPTSQSWGEEFTLYIF